MSYRGTVRRPGARRARARPARHQPMGGFWDTIVSIVAPGPSLLASSTFGSGGSDAACAQAMQRAQADLDARTDDLSRNWKPTGYYLVTDMVKMRDQVMKVMADASNAVDDAAGQALQMRDNLREAQGKVQSKMRDSLTYSSAIAAALERNIRVIDAPAFRSWVLDSLGRAAHAYGVIAYEDCLKPGVLKAFEAVKRAWDVVVIIGKAMVRATIALGEQILKIPAALETLWTITKWGGLAYVAYLALRKRKPGAGS